MNENPLGFFRCQVCVYTFQLFGVHRLINMKFLLIFALIIIQTKSELSCYTSNKSEASCDNVTALYMEVRTCELFCEKLSDEINFLDMSWSGRSSEKIKDKGSLLQNSS